MMRRATAVQVCGYRMKDNRGARVMAKKERCRNGNGRVGFTLKLETVRVWAHSLRHFRIGAAPNSTGQVA